MSEPGGGDESGKIAKQGSSEPAKPEPDPQGQPQDDDVLIPEVLEDLPEPQRTQIMNYIRSSSTAYMGYQPPHPMWGKVTSEHLTQIIDQGGQQVQAEMADRKDVRKNLLIASIALLATLVVLGIWGDPDLLFEVLKLAGAAAGGYGWASFRRRD
jgi:hypothetical protein